MVHSLDEAVAAAGADEVLVVGGAELYALALPLAQRLYLTLVEAEVEGDALFPVLDPAQWREVGREPHPADDRHAYPFSFVTLERVETRRPVGALEAKARSMRHALSRAPLRPSAGRPLPDGSFSRPSAPIPDPAGLAPEAAFADHGSGRWRYARPAGLARGQPRRSQPTSASSRSIISSAWPR